MTQLSITTDYCTCLGDPVPYLQNIAAAGFSHVMWCHHFGDDYLYSPDELKSLLATLKQLGIRLLDVHGSDGKEHCWSSLDENSRREGMELVKNRVELLQRLEGAGTLIMHMPAIYYSDKAEDEARRRAAYGQFLRSLDELMPWLEKKGVVLALENMPNETWELLETTLQRYPSKQVGLCYDSGHGNINGRGLPFLERNKDRLLALHLNDNDGARDIHQPPMMGTVEWAKLADIIARSSYAEPLNFEITMRATPFTQKDADGKPLPQQPDDCQMAYLRDALRRSQEFADMVEGARTKQR